MKKILVGITGGIGSGKSLVSIFFEKKGFTVLKSDLIAKDLMTNDLKIKQRIIKSFGDNSYRNGKLDTKFLSENVFCSQEKVSIINSIVHPAVLKKNKQIAKNEFEKNNIVFVESALIYEAHIENEFDYIILIYSEEEIRISRAIKRDRITKEQVVQRMKYQMPDEMKKEKADFVVENNGSTNELNFKLNFVLNLLISITNQ